MFICSGAEPAVSYLTLTKPNGHNKQGDNNPLNFLKQITCNTNQTEHIEFTAMIIVLKDSDIDFVDNRIDKCRTILLSQWFDDNQDKWINDKAEMMFNELEQLKEFLITK